MDNNTRRVLLEKIKTSGYPGSVLDVFASYDQGVDLVQDYINQQQEAAGRMQSQQSAPPESELSNQQSPQSIPQLPPQAPPQPLNIPQTQEPANTFVNSGDKTSIGLANIRENREASMINSPAKMEMGGSYDTNQEISMYEWNTGRPKQYIKGGVKTKAINRFANGGPGDPPPTEETDNWYKSWYSGRQTLPQFKDIAKERLDYLNANPTQAATISDDEMNRLTGSKSAIGLYYPDDEKDADRYGNKVLVTDKGYKEQGSPLVTHETSHLLDWNTPQKNTSLYYSPNPKVRDYTRYLPIIEEGDAPITEEEIRSAKEQALANTPAKWRDAMYSIIPEENYIPRSEGEEDTLKTGFKDDKQVNYQYSPTELRARLNVWRREMNLDPTKDYSIEEIDNMIKNNQGIENPNIRELYKIVRSNPELLKQLHDTYVMNPNKNNDLSYTYTAKLGGFTKMLYNKSKYKK